MIDIMLYRLTNLCEWLVISELLYSIVFVTKKQAEISLFFQNSIIANEATKIMDFMHNIYKKMKENEINEIGVLQISQEGNEFHSW